MTAKYGCVAGHRSEADRQDEGLDVAQGHHPQGCRDPDSEGWHRSHHRVPWTRG